MRGRFIISSGGAFLCRSLGRSSGGASLGRRSANLENLFLKFYVIKISFSSCKTIKCMTILIIWASQIEIRSLCRTLRQSKTRLKTSTWWRLLSDSLTTLVVGRFELNIKPWREIRKSILWLGFRNEQITFCETETWLNEWYSRVCWMKN